MGEGEPDRSADDAVHALLAQARTLAAKDGNAALALLEKSPAPQHGLYHHALGSLRLRAGRVDDAVASFEAAVALLPDVPDIRANLGGALLARARPAKPGDPPRREDVERACAVLSEAVAARPLFADAGASLVFALELLGRSGEAIVAADANLGRFPDDAATLLNKASALKSLKRLDEAKQVLAVVVARHEGHPAAAAAAQALARLS